MEPYRHRKPREERASSTFDRKTLLQDPLLLPRRGTPGRQVPHGVRVLLRVLSLALSVATIGLYDRWQYPHGTLLPAWPADPNMRPTYLLLAAAAVGTLFNNLALLTLFGAFKQARASAFGPLSAISSCFMAFALSTAAVAYYNLWNTKKRSQTDLWMWTCTHKQFEVTAGGTEFTFRTICTELTFVWYAGIAVAAVEFVNFAACLYNTVKVEIVGSKKSYGYSRLEREKFLAK